MSETQTKTKTSSHAEAADALAKKKNITKPKMEVKKPKNADAILKKATAGTKPVKKTEGEATKKTATPKKVAAGPKKPATKPPAKKSPGGQKTPAPARLTRSSINSMACLGGVRTKTSGADDEVRDYLMQVAESIVHISAVQAKKCGRYTINPEDVFKPLNTRGFVIDMSKSVAQNNQKKKKKKEESKKV